MNDGDVSKQMQQMMRFILHEAEEKANEISVSAEELNVSRIKVLQVQDDIVNAMKDKALKELLNCLLRFKEPSVLLRCREEDLSVVETVLDDAKEVYEAKTKVHAPEVAVDQRIVLPPPPKSHDPHSLHCSGGVVLASRDGKIVCENTLDALLDFAV